MDKIRRGGITMSQQNKIGTGHTTIKTDKAGITTVTFWSTDIVKFDSKTITLNSGGYRTATTKTRMNQASNQFNLGYQVKQENYKWYVYFTGKKFVFKDGMILNRNQKGKQNNTEVKIK
jgi:hypothetical protein